MLMSLINSGFLGFVVELREMVNVLIGTLVFVIIGLIIFALVAFLFDKLMPYSVHKEIEEDQNTALGIIIGSMMIGIAIIIAAAIHG